MHHFIPNIPRRSTSQDGSTKLLLRQKRPSVYLKGFGAEINLISTDLNICKKSTNTTEPACRPNPNFLKQRFRITITTPKNYGESLAMCYSDSQPRCWCTLIFSGLNSSLVNSPLFFRKAINSSPWGTDFPPF